MKYIILSILLIAGCSGSKNLSSDKLMNIEKATMQKSIGGAPGSGISYTYALTVNYDTDKTIHFDTLWVADKPGLPVQVIRADRKQYGKPFQKGETLIIRARTIVNGVMKNETEGGPAPIEYEGAALLGFTVEDSEKMYLVIEELTELEKKINP